MNNSSGRYKTLIKDVKHDLIVKKFNKNVGFD